MATEIDIPESVLLKKGEIEDKALSSEILEEKVIEILGNKVKQLETSNLVAETVNKQLETGISTNESGTFFQALSVPIAIAAEHSNTPESYESKTTEDQEERKSTIIKASPEEKPNDDVEAVSIHSECKEVNDDKNDEKTIEIDDEDQEKELKLEKDQAATCEDIKETITGQDATIVADSKEQDLNERAKEFLNEEKMDKSTDAQEASEKCENEGKDKREQTPKESIKKIVLSSPDIDQEEKDDEVELKMEQNEFLHDITTDTYFSTQTKSQVDTTEYEVKNEEEATLSDGGRKEESDNPSIKELCEDNSSDKVECESSSVKLNEKTREILNKYEEEEKEQEVKVFEKDQGEDPVTSAQFEGEFEEKNQHSEGIEPEVVEAKESIEEDTEEIIYSSATPENIEPQSLIKVLPADVSIKTQTKPEEETINNYEEAIKNDDVHTKESGSSMVMEICDETVSDKAEFEEWLNLSDSSNTASHENEIPNKDDDQELNVSEKGQAESQVATIKLEGYKEQVIEKDDSKKESSSNLSIKEACEQKEKDQEEDEVTDSQEETSKEDLQAKSNVTIKNEEKNDEKAIEKDACEEMGPKNVEPEVGLKLSDNKEPSNKEALSTTEKDQGDTDGIKSSQDTAREDVEETLVADVKELNESPREFVKQEMEEKSIDAQEESEECENETENKPEQKSEGSVEKIEQEEETEEISSHVEIDEKMEQNGVSDGATSDASLSTQSKPQVETTEHEEKDEEEATHVDDGQKGELDNPTITEVCEENSSEKVEFESSVVKLNETTTEILNEGEDEEKEEDVNVLQKDQHDEDVTSAQKVKLEGSLEEKNHDTEGNEQEVVEAKDYIEADTEEIIYSVGTPENIEHQSLINVIPNDVIITTQTNSKEETTKNEEAIKSDDGQTKESGSPMVKEVCEETVLDKAEFEEGLKLSDSYGMTTTENEIANNVKDQEKEQDQENDGVAYSQDATFTEDSQAKNNESIITEENNDQEAIQKEACEETIPESSESEVGLKLSDNMEPSKQEALNTIEKDHGDTQGVTRSQDATSVDIKETTSGKNATIVADFTELNEKPREFVKEEMEDKPFYAQEVSEKCENGADEKIVEKPEERVMKIEQEEETEETSPHVITDEKMEQNEDIASGASVSTQTKSSQVEITNIDEKDEEDATPSENGQKENPDNTPINEACEENSFEKIEYESSTMKLDENTIAVLNKDEDEEKEKEVKVLDKDQSEDGVAISQDVPFEECLEETNQHSQGIEPEVTKTKETIEENSEEIRSSAETTETTEQQSLISTIPIDIGISTQTEIEKETTESQEKNAEVVIESDDSPVDKEIYDDAVSDKAIKDEDQENEQELDISELSASGGDDITSSQNAATEDIIETTTGQHVTPVVYAEEHGLSAIPKETLTEGTEEKSIDAQEASEHEDGANNESEQKPEEIVNEIVSEIEQKEYIKEIKPSVETNEENDVCISTETESQEEATQNDENDLRKTGSEELTDLSTSSDVEKETSSLSKDDVQEQDQELNISEKDQCKDEVTCSHEATAVPEEDLQGKSVDEGNKHELGETRESTKDENDVIRTAIESEEIMEKQIESQEETIGREVCEETVKEVCEETSSEQVESEECLQLSDSSTIMISEKIIKTSKEKGEEATTEIEERNNDETIENDDVIRSQNEPKEDIQETIGQNATTVVCFVEGHDKAMTTDILEQEAEDTSLDAQEATEKCENEANDEREQKPEESLNRPVSSSADSVEECFKEDEADPGIKKENLEEVQQAKRTEDISEIKDEVVSTEKMSSELGQPKEQNDEEIQECPTETIRKKTEDEITEKVDDSSQESIEEKNDDTTKEVTCFLDETTREIEIPTLEKELNDEKNGGLDEVSNETTEVESQEDISSLETSTEDTSNSEKTKVECKDLPIEDVESVSKEQIIEVVPESKDLKLTEEFLTSAATTHVDEEKETITNEISSDEKTEETTDIKQESVEEGREVTNSEKAETEEGVEDAGIKTKENTEKLGILHVITTEVCRPTQTAPKEECFENEEKSDDEAEASSDKVGSEEGPKYSDSFNTPLDENNIVTNEENLEKEQQLIMSEVQGGGDDVIISENASNEDIKEMTGQHATTVAHLEEEQSPMPKEIHEEEAEDKSIDTQEIPLELDQPEEQISEDIQEKVIDITKGSKDLSHDSIEDKVLDDRTRDIEPQEDITLSSSSEILTKHTSNSEEVKEVCENLAAEDLESVFEVPIPEAAPKSEASKLKEESVISETATYVHEEQVTVTKEISSDQNLKPYGEHKLTLESMNDDHIDETTQPEESHITHEKKDSLYEERDMKEEVTQEKQLNSAEDCSEMVKDIFLTEKIEQVPLEIIKENEIKDLEQLVEGDNSSTEQTQKEIAHEISYSDPIPDGNAEVTEVAVDAQLIVKEDLQATEDISCESKVENNNVVEATKEEIIPSLDDAPMLEPQVDFSNTRDLESVHEVTVESEDSKVKEECIILETAAYTDENKVEEEHKIITNDISSAADTEEENVKQTPTESDKEKISDLNTEEKASTEENVELDGEVKPTSESMIEENQVNEAKHPPEQSDITSENIIYDQNSVSKLEHTSTKDLEDEKRDMDFTLSPEDKIKSIECQNETKKNVILTEKVAVETEVDKSSSDRKELANALLGGIEKIDANDDIEVIADGEVKAIEETYQDAVAKVTVHDQLSQTDEKTMSMATPEELAFVLAEDQLNEILPETDMTKVEHNSISNTDRSLERMEEEITKNISEDQIGIKENYVEEEGKDNFGIKDKEAKVENEVVEDVIVNEILLEVENAKESQSIEDDQLTSAKNEVHQIESLNSSPDELYETKDTTEDPKPTAENLNLEAEASSSTEQVIQVRSDESESHGDMQKLEEKPIEVSDVTSEVAATTVPESTEPSPKILLDDPEITTTAEKIEAEIKENDGMLQVPIMICESDDGKQTNSLGDMPNKEREAVEPQEHISDIKSDVKVKKHVEQSEENTLISSNDENTEDSLITPSEEKERFEETPLKDVQKHEKDVELQLLDTKEATLESVSLENQREQKKEADENIEAAIPIEDARHSDVESLSDLDVPVPTRDRSKTTEEVSGIKQEPLELDAPAVTAATRDLEISQKDVTDDPISKGQNQPDVQKHEVAASSFDKLSHDNESKLLTQNIDASHGQGESTTKLLIPEPEVLKATKASGSEPQCSSEVFKEETNINDKSASAALANEEIGDSGVKTDEENEEEEDNENSSSYSEAPVMVEASKDMEVKVQKKSHNILSGVGSKVKHSIAKVKKAITGGKSSPSKSSATKETI